MLPMMTHLPETLRHIRPTPMGHSLRGGARRWSGICKQGHWPSGGHEHGSSGVAEWCGGRGRIGLVVFAFLANSPRLPESQRPHCQSFARYSFVPQSPSGFPPVDDGSQPALPHALRCLPCPQSSGVSRLRRTVLDGQDATVPALAAQAMGSGSQVGPCLVADRRPGPSRAIGPI